MKASEVTKDMIGEEVWVKCIIEKVEEIEKDTEFPVYLSNLEDWVRDDTELSFTKPAPSKREIVEMSPTAIGDKVGIIAKANDNTLWAYEHEINGWKRFPDLPQDGLAIKEDGVS